MSDKQGEKPNFRNYAIFSSAVIQMGVIIAGGAFFGQWLDGKYPNEHKLFTVVFTLLGVGASLWILIRQLQQLNKED